MWRYTGSIMALALAAGPLAAQTDYRNLDDDRPAPTEDAYPVEQGALELVFPWLLEQGHGASVHALVPELAWGALPNLHLGVKAPLALRDLGDSDAGLAGIRAFGLYNFFTESRTLPALALRGDLALPVGEFGGEDLRGSLELIATRSFGPWRVHANGAFGFADPARAALVEPLPRWSAGGAIDRTLYRQSLLLIGDVTASAATRQAPTEVNATLGLRWQWTPTTVLDAGVTRRLTEDGPDLGLTLGLTHVVGMPRRVRPAAPVSTARSPEASAPSLEQRSERFYLPGSFNWQFLARYPEAARLFNAFDYGHATLYERLHRNPGAPLEVLEKEEFAFLTRDLLIHPPRLGVPEEAIAPSYARFAWRAMAMFHWAHLLHRQVYDIYAAEGLGDSARIALVERVTDDYLADHDLAFTTVPKAMALMDEAFYSQDFRKRYPKFNGLIWAYHWLQVGLYEPLIAGKDEAQRKAGVAATLAQFWGMLEDAPTRMPRVMPMTAAVAPEFSRRHPRAAVVFDNLHMMHDIISDILLADRVPAERKRAEIYAALAKFQDPTRETMTMDEWSRMGELMGGVELMGGQAGGAPSRPILPAPAGEHQH